MLGMMLLLGFAMIAALGAIPTASAATTSIVDSTSCSSIGGSWAGSTCTLSTSYTNTAGNTLEVPSGTTLAIGPSGTIVNDGTIQVDSGGIVMITSSSDFYGIENYGLITNAGTMNLANTAYYAIWSAGGSITNTGTIDITTSGAFGTMAIYSIFYNGVTPTITNSGDIYIQNTGSSYGIYIGFSTLTNTASGKIYITNSGELGIYNVAGTVTDNGLISAENTGPSNYGIDNNGPMTVAGTLTVGSANDAVLNQASITQECGGVINGPGTINGNPYIPATGCTVVPVPEFPMAGFGPLLLALLVPALLVLSRKIRKPQPLA
jgi:hypothetical protein